MADTNALQAIEMTVYDTAGLTASLAALNGSGVPNRLKVLKMYNASDTDITLSLNGSTDQDFIQSGGTFILDLQANNDRASGGGGSWHVAKNQIIYGSGSAGTGNLYIIGYY